MINDAFCNKKNNFKYFNNKKKTLFKCVNKKNIFIWEYNDNVPYKKLQLS